MKRLCFTKMPGAPLKTPSKFYTSHTDQHQVIQNYFFSDWQIFVDDEGYDCLKRVYNHGEFPNVTYDKTFTPNQEREVLLDIYEATNGKQWYNTTAWNSSTTHCAWYGITCHNNTYVKTIVLAYNNLDGSLPSNLWKIRNLMALCTPGNPRLRGRIGDFLFGNMSKLLTVVLNAASITGDIPQDIAKLSYLQNFLGCTMHGDGFTGRLPDNIGNMTELRLLCLGGNNLTGQIPRSISRLNKLYYLDLKNTPGMMHGHLSDLFSISSLNFLSVSGVKLIGEMPSMLPANLVSLILPGNSISGKFPQTIPEINKLEALNLANNELTGDIPGQLLLFPQMKMIDLSQNKFSSINKGKPWLLKKNVSAGAKSYVSLAGNRNLNIELASFMEIFEGGPLVLNLSNCDIDSPLPARVFYFTMTTCDLHKNKFYGEIPDIFGDTSILTYFDISSNNLSGSFPLGIQTLISLQFLDISGNPSMQEGTTASSTVFRPDFSRMFTPTEEDNFTCPEGRLTISNGRIRLDPTFYEYKHCVCDTGFYGHSGLCKKCMDGGTCPQFNFTESNYVYPNNMTLRGGYWPSPTPNSVTHLVKCPVSTACNPSAACTCRLERLETTPKHTNSSHHRPSVSSLITTCNLSCICHEGNTDRFCSRCQDGFYKLGGLCFKCPKGDQIYYYLFIPSFAVSFLALLWSYFYFNLRPMKWFAVTAAHFLLMLTFMLLELLPAWVFKLNLVVFVLCMTSRGKAAQPLISITVFYIQTMDFLISSANVWPKKVVVAQTYLSSYWNLYFPSLSCDLPSFFTPVGKFAFVLLLPVACMAMIGLYFIILMTYDRFRRDQERMENVHFKCRQSAFFCLNFSYFPIVKQTLSILRPCHNDRDVLYMPNFPWIECTSHTYKTLSVLGGVSVAFYLIGFPLLLIYLMFAFFRKREIMSPEDREKLDAWLGPVYLPYKPKYQHFFEVFMLLRRLLLATALSMISSSSSLQTFVVWLILMVSAILCLRLEPYDNLSINRWAQENVFEPLVLFVLSMSFMLVRFSALDSSYTVAFVWVVMFVNSCVLVVLVGVILRLLVVTGNSSDNGDLAGAREDESNNDDERRGLLPVNEHPLFNFSL